jgi:L-seryl-tRNA(Ser) seleniumtransferase
MSTKSKASSLYDRLGVKPIINAAGTVTRLGGSRPRPEVLEAMAQAAGTMVNMAELNHQAGEVIARATGAEAGLVCNGAASGLMLQAAAVIAGSDPARMARLPDTDGMKNEIIIQTMHRFVYDQAYRAAGARLVTVGEARKCQDWELEAAINDRTAAVAYLFSPFTCKTPLPLPLVVEIAHKHGVPVIVDAASMVPPRENLRKYIRQGADLVTISGGKGILGPQGSGLLFGRKDLVGAAWANASPNQFIGRGMKVSKEEIVGFVAALDIFVKEDEAAQMARFRRMSQQVVDALIEVPGISVTIEHDDHDYLIPCALITLAKSWKGRPRAELLKALESGNPPIHLQTTYQPENEMAVDPFNVSEEELSVLIRRLREELTRR